LIGHSLISSGQSTQPPTTQPTTQGNLVACQLTNQGNIIANQERPNQLLNKAIGVF